MAGYTAGTLSVTGGGSTAPTADLPVVCISAKAPDGLLRCTRNNTTRRRITENVLRGAHQGTDETAAFSSWTHTSQRTVCRRTRPRERPKFQKLPLRETLEGNSRIGTVGRVALTLRTTRPVLSERFEHLYGALRRDDVY